MDLLPPFAVISSSCLFFSSHPPKIENSFVRAIFSSSSDGEGQEGLCRHCDRILRHHTCGGDEEDVILGQVQVLE
jgi:hypothetical protein